MKTIKITVMKMARDNLQKIPFENESIIIDLIKEGQVNKEKIEKFF